LELLPIPLEVAMFERILIPLDGSPRAELILAQIGRILRRADSEILLLRVLESMPSLARVDTAALLRKDREEAQAYLHDLAQRLGAAGASKVHARIAEGSAAETVLKVADDEGATLLAMTTHGRSGVARWAMGSVAEKLARHAKIPLLLLRSFRRNPYGDLEPAVPVEFPFRKILLPVDGSEASLEAVTPAEKVAALYDSEVVLLHAMPPWPPAGAVLPGMEAGMPEPQPIPNPDQDPATEKAAARLRHAGLAVVRRTVAGDPAAEIVDLSHASGVDLIVMATHGRSGVARWMLGSTAERVVRSVGVPVLLVRSRA
jgi:nucleotide-binding universal stress UspA family protein